ncbi:MAG TPA: hypothetical protein EYQ43_08690 [Methyloprofundus sp.]|uniref:hypothetical protein n=1 Tax=Methyloprofundus sp. TaxID=2020875 RepID=UPI00185DD94E|nr:hypothetical protein [Methyloprofundus sp.]HIG65609.1 hypothetical protein [Methyloprofundus sp.]HIL77530.1 hypothetical protein [Methylococcales bacterium]
MFGGVLTILVAIWVYRTAVRAKSGNVLFWTAGAAVLFIVVQVLFYNINIFIIDGYGNDVGSEYDRDLTDIGDRVTNSGGSGGIQEGFFGTVLGVLFEIMPLFMGWLSVAFMRTKFLLKEDPKKIGNLVSGIKEVFTAIIKSFKTSE